MSDSTYWFPFPRANTGINDVKRKIQYENPLWHKLNYRYIFFCKNRRIQALEPFTDLPIQSEVAVFIYKKL